MGIRFVRAVVTIAVVGVGMSPFQSEAVRPQPTGKPGRMVKPVWMPLGVGKQPVTVVLEMSGDPVAVQQEAAGRRLQRHEKDQIKASLRGGQQSLHGSIQAMGGTVLANYQSAYNGVKVRITADRLGQLASLPGVVAVRHQFPVRRSNVLSVPLIGAPAVWQNPGLHGEGVKIAFIDTGIDYTHANFGGPGTPAAYEAAHASETLPANPAYFGPRAPRVKGGIDLVGDSYNADPQSPGYQPIPRPDPNPLDCGDGHGSHVAGSAAGSGVTAAGTTYTGRYDAATVNSNAWTIAPGVAPRADLYAVRVFGCDGSSDVIVDAIDWAVDNDMDVINLSVGTTFGSKDSPDAAAATNAARAGVLVVAGAGNDGENPYMISSPASADGAIAVAANSARATFPGAALTLSTGGAPLAAQNSNEAVISNGTTLPVVVLRDSTGRVSLGCAQQDYVGVAGKLVVTRGGDCPFFSRAVFAQRARAAAAVLISEGDEYPPFEGPVNLDPDTNEPYVVTIPFLGLRGPAESASSDGGRLAAANGRTVTLANSTVPDEDFLRISFFSSSGPRGGDGGLKPNLTAPGVEITSTAIGTGNQAGVRSGTSMATPHVAGVAALTRQAHPNWSVAQVMAAVVNTGDPGQALPYRAIRAGNGMVQAHKAVATQVTAREEGRPFGVSLSFGLEEMKRDFSGQKDIKLRNHGNTPATFTVAQVMPAGSPHTVALDRSVVTVPARGAADVRVTLAVPAASAGASNGAGLSFREVAGIVRFTPVSSTDNNGVTLNMPYYLVPRALSDVSTQLGQFRGANPVAAATVTNRNGAIAGDADFYAWGLEGSRMPGRASNDIRAVGVQSFPHDEKDRMIVFAVNTFDRWSTASTNEFDIRVDVDGDGIDDYVIIGADDGLLSFGFPSGTFSTFVFSTRSPFASTNFQAIAPTDSSTALLAVLTSDLCRPGEPCLSAANPRITYRATGFDLVNDAAKSEVPGTSAFNVYAPAISQGGLVKVAPGATKSTIISVNAAEWKLTPSKGLMVVTLDNKSGTEEAQLIRIEPRR